MIVPKKPERGELCHATWLPCFPGFYNSFLLNEDIEQQAFNEYVGTLADCYGFDSKLLDLWLDDSSWLKLRVEEFENDVAVNYCIAVEDRLIEILRTPVRIYFQSIHHPREYNFATDSVHCLIAIDIDKVLAYCREHQEDCVAYLEENYTSYDGFISSHSTLLEEWFDPEQWSEHHLGSLLQFILYLDNSDCEYQFSERVLEQTSLSSYYEGREIDDVLESPEGLKIRAEYDRCCAQGEEYRRCKEVSVARYEGAWETMAKLFAQDLEELTEKLSERR